MHLIQGRLVLALGFSTAAHAGLALVVSDPLATSAAPAQRALTVAMAPAAPRAVQNSIAPTATAALAPPLVESLSAPSAEVIDEPDGVLVTRSADVVTSLDAPLMASRGPEEQLRARDVRAAVVAVAAPSASMITRPALQRSSAKKPSSRRPPGAATARPKASATAASRPTASASARASQPDKSAAAAPANRPQAVAGQPGADRQAAPASGNEPPAYPWTARAQGHQGRVVLRVWVSAGGEAQRLAVARSSGYSALDRAAMEAVQQWRFRPARHAGVDTQSQVHVPVVFRLDGN